MRTIRIAAAGLLGMIAACGDSSTSNTQTHTDTLLASLAVQPESASLGAVDSLRFTAIAHDSAGRVKSNVVVSWSTAAATGLSIDATGMLRSNNTTYSALAGQVIATAIVSSGPPLRSVSHSANVTVRGADPPYELWPDTIGAWVGSPRTLESRFDYYSQASNGLSSPLIIDTAAASWTSSDPTIATVDTKGTITPVAPGQITVTAALASGRKATAQITVIQSPGPLRFSNVTSDAADFTPGVYQPVGPEITGCGLNTGDGALYCWGQFGYLWGEFKTRVISRSGYLPSGYASAFDRCEDRSQEGAGSTIDFEIHRCSSNPTRILAPATFAQFPSLIGASFGAKWSCALDSSGQAFCWGSNTSGQVGIGTTDSLPHGVTAVASAQRFQSIAPGPCAIRADGAAYCWGGAFGSTPVAVSGGIAWASLTAPVNGRQCGLAVDSTAYCWTGTNTPTAVSPGAKWSTIVANASIPPCGLSTAGAPYCWITDASGNLTSPAVAVSGAPSLTFLGIAAVSGLGSTLSAGVAWVPCGLSSAGAMYCITSSGSGTSTTFSAQLVNTGGIQFTRFDGFCGIATDAKAYCWSSTGPSTAKVLPGQ